MHEFLLEKNYVTTKAFKGWGEGQAQVLCLGKFPELTFSFHPGESYSLLLSSFLKKVWLNLNILGYSVKAARGESGEGEGPPLGVPFWNDQDSPLASFIESILCPGIELCEADSLSYLTDVETEVQGSGEAGNRD